jgi:hypothetical protein
MRRTQASLPDASRNGSRALLLVTLALIASTASRCLVALGAPGIIDFVHIPLVLAAVGVATPEIRRTRATRKACFWIGILFLDAVMAWVASGGELVRPVVGWMLMVEPILLAVAVASALVTAPAPARAAAIRRIEDLVILIALVQLPFALVQAAQGGVGDHIQGTFIGLGSGAHIAGAVTFVGAIALCARAMRERTRVGLSFALIAALLLTSVVADAKQVEIAAVPAILVLVFFSDVLTHQPAVVRKAAALAVLALAIGTVWIFAASYRPLNQPGGGQTIEQGRRGKVVAFDLITEDMNTRPETLFVGLGAGNTVGKLATLTVGAGVKANSPVAFLHLGQAEITAEILRLDKSNYVSASSSVWSGLSSVLGLFGDFGLVGMFAFVAAWWALLRPGAKSRGPDRAVALSLVTFAGLLGVFHIWLEEPNFMLPLAALFATAVTASIAGQNDHASDSDLSAIDGGAEPSIHIS